jgi:hypothetical protein
MTMKIVPPNTDQAKKDTANPDKIIEFQNAHMKQELVTNGETAVHSGNRLYF